MSDGFDALTLPCGEPKSATLSCYSCLRDSDQLGKLVLFICAELVGGRSIKESPAEQLLHVSELDQIKIAIIQQLIVAKEPTRDVPDWVVG